MINNIFADGNIPIDYNVFGKDIIVKKKKETRMSSDSVFSFLGPIISSGSTYKGLEEKFKTQRDETAGFRMATLPDLYYSLKNCTAKHIKEIQKSLEGNTQITNTLISYTRKNNKQTEPLIVTIQHKHPRSNLGADFETRDLSSLTLDTENLRKALFWTKDSQKEIEKNLKKLKYPVYFSAICPFESNPSAYAFGLSKGKLVFQPGKLDYVGVVTRGVRLQ